MIAKREIGINSKCSPEEANSSRTYHRMEKVRRIPWDMTLSFYDRHGTAGDHQLSPVQRDEATKHHRNSSLPLVKRACTRASAKHSIHEFRTGGHR
jgi:hypothetical protein